VLLGKGRVHGCGVEGSKYLESLDPAEVGLGVETACIASSPGVVRDRKTSAAIQGDGVVPTADGHRHAGIRSGRPARDEDVEEHQT
jgi:hypothetical protein